MVQQQSKEWEEGIQRKTRGNVRNTVVRSGNRDTSLLTGLFGDSVGLPSYSLVH